MGREIAFAFLISGDVSTDEVEPLRLGCNGRRSAPFSGRETIGANLNGEAGAAFIKVTGALSDEAMKGIVAFLSSSSESGR